MEVDANVVATRALRYSEVRRQLCQSGSNVAPVESVAVHRVRVDQFICVIVCLNALDGALLLKGSETRYRVPTDPEVPVVDHLTNVLQCDAADRNAVLDLR